MNRMMKFGYAAAFALASVAAVGGAQAATATGTMAVSATVVSSCTVAAAPLTFASYNPTQSTATTSSTSLTLTCTPGVTYHVGLDAGGGSGATTSVRVMSLSTAKLNYQLCQDSGCTTNWGNTNPTDTVNGTASTLVTTIPVYGQIAASQGVAAGVYTDTVNITVNY